MIGTTLAHYQITAHLGTGGMGEVYRATDTKLGRDVAIKILPEAVARDPERVARFEREARTLATLQHPHVASIYGLEQAGGHRFLVMELAEGEDLAQRMQRGKIPLADVPGIARQIATGLEAAHEKGIVHRDLKPANIKLAANGSIKILDFGLARAFASDDGTEADLEHSPTITAAMTQAGVILGTAAYMSPEQARGKPVDRRADIWAFGVILHEMLTGQRLFAGDTLSDTLAGVLKTPLDLDRLPGETPPKLSWLVGRCLDRDPKQRLRDIGEARVLLEGPLDESTIEPARRSSRWPWLALGGIAGAVLGVMGIRVLAPSAPDAVTPRVKFEIPTARSGQPVRLAVDPTGTRLVFTDFEGLHVRAFDQLEVRSVPGVEEALVPAWSPDGRWIAYSTGPRIYKIRPDGSDRFLLCDVPGGMHPWAGGVSWLDDGRVVFSPGDSGLWEVSEQGGDPTQFLETSPDETDFHCVSALPGGKGFLFVPHANDYFDRIHLYTNGERKELLFHTQQHLTLPVYLSGHLVYSRAPVNAGIWAVPFSLETLSVAGDPFLVVPDARSLAPSSKGVLAYTSASEERRSLGVVDRQGNVTVRIGEPATGMDAEFARSPDESQIAVSISQEEANVWIYEVSTGARRRLTFDGFRHHPRWFPDGHELMDVVGFNIGDRKLERRKLDGSDPQTFDIRVGEVDVSRDGQILVFSEYDHAADSGIVWADVNDLPDRTTLVDTDASEHSPRLSPDGRYVAYASTATGRPEVYVQDFPGAARKWQISQNGGENPLWSTDGSRLYFRQGSRFYEVDVRTEPSLTLGPPKLMFEDTDVVSIEVSEDPGRFFAVLRETKDGKQPSIHVWMNWEQASALR